MRDIEKCVESLEGRSPQPSRAKWPRLDSPIDDLYSSTGDMEDPSGEEADPTRPRNSRDKVTNTASPTQAVSQVPGEMEEDGQLFAEKHCSSKPQQVETGGLKAGDGEDEWPQCMGHIRNGMSVTAELFMWSSDLLAVQTMVGLALFFQGTPNPQPLFMYTAAAIRFAQSIGLHKSNPFGLFDLQVEERRRVIWLAFVLDADICTRESVSLFYILAQFTLFPRRAYDMLFTKEALEKPMSERASAARACVEEIERWEDSIPHILRPQRRFAPEQHHPFLPQIIRLHFACQCFYVSVSRVCLISQQERTRSEEVNVFPSLPLTSDEVTAKSLEAARSAVDLLCHIDDNGFGQSFEWSVVYFPAAAVVALFSQITLEPDHPLAASDLLMITRTIGFLSKLASQEPDTYADYVLSVCSGV
ncbi:hypothetical protein BP00DRAFT_451770 [Aspergillus indologenus CBS 114.80]|uniref:Xylanolytic transcriptional activator regulatory domain-containing protein n=1 Tax=Aspergillus indologenus CBS 114.80 TaxID=1450541 RepID=A0A2V5IPE2_9EURO|nr:hypothetical protein BP00DRAFT_451770 [Aspergillus indologenus CBS 114.80]